MVRDFPKEAIKLVSKIDNEIKIFENIDFQDAFYELGDKFRDKKMVFVEDKLAKYIVDFIIEKEKRQNFSNNIEVKYIPGGAENIIKHHIMSSALKEEDNCLFLLDGDKKVDYDKHRDIIKPEYLCDGSVDVSKIPESDNLVLKEIIKTMTGDDIKFNVSGRSGNSNKSELIEAQKKFIAFWENNVRFLPVDTPEKFLAELDNDPAISDTQKNGKNGKEYFIKKAKVSLGREKVGSNDIFEEQKRVVSKIDKGNELYKSVINMLEGLFKAQ